MNILQTAPSATRSRTDAQFALVDAWREEYETAELRARVAGDDVSDVLMPRVSDTGLARRANREYVERLLPVAWHLKRLHACLYDSNKTHPYTRLVASRLRRELLAEYVTMRKRCRALVVVEEQVA